MPKTVQIRNLDDKVYASLVKRAAETGISVPKLLRIEATKLAACPSMAEWLKRVQAVPRRSSAITTEHVVATLDEWRGRLPDAGD
ncbi:MAG: hypothetical protein ACR2LK_01040 [Solirubrobacteraceae bacterium]